MDLLRLALERCRTAREALQTITHLLEAYGQGGACGYRDKKFRYDNSFLMADRKQAFVLETFGREWAAKKVSRTAAISNMITLTTDYSMASERLGEYARKKGWWKGRSRLNLQEVYSNRLFTYFSGAKLRRACSLKHLQGADGKLGLLDLFRALRSHHGADGRPYEPFRGNNGDVCMHAANALIRKSQTVGSMVAAVFPEGAPLVFVTATSAPCLSVFKPVFLDLPVPWTYPQRGPQTFLSGHLWWEHELFHRMFLFRYGRFYQNFSEERRELEEHFVRQAVSLHGAPAEERKDFVRRCAEEAAVFERKWLEILRRAPAKHSGFFYRRYWKKLSRRNRLPGKL